jgi:hypothetical protein
MRRANKAVTSDSNSEQDGDQHAEVLVGNGSSGRGLALLLAGGRHQHKTAHTDAGA